MLVSREELRFQFKTNELKAARFNLSSPQDRKFLAWVFDQFLLGEASGVQCGHWLYHAPSFRAATFLARQATEELSHFRRILVIFAVLGEKPSRAHPAIRFLTSGMMGGTWGEHVAIEMALGEGLVLGAFYALADTIDEPRIQKILLSAVLEEERHVEFGETETQRWLALYPHTRKLLLGLALVQLTALQWMKNFIVKRLARELSPGEAEAGVQHPVMNSFEKFYEHLLICFSWRIERLGLSNKSVQALTRWERADLWLGLPFRMAREKLFRKKTRLTETYLTDPVLETELAAHPPGASTAAPSPTASP